MKIARNANEILIRMLQSGLQFESLIVESQNMRALEKQSDEIAFGIKRAITNGAVSPIILDNLLACVDVADSVVDDYYYLAREITRIARVESTEIRTSPLNSAFLTMLDLAAKSFATVEELLAEKDIDKVMRQRQEIERLEERGDEIKDDAFDQLYAVSPRMHYIDFTHYSEILHKLDDILDYCEDLSDLIVAITTSISR